MTWIPKLINRIGTPFQIQIGITVPMGQRRFCQHAVYINCKHIVTEFAGTDRSVTILEVFEHCPIKTVVSSVISESYLLSRGSFRDNMWRWCLMGARTRSEPWYRQKCDSRHLDVAPVAPGVEARPVSECCRDPGNIQATSYFGSCTLRTHSVALSRALPGVDSGRPR